MDTLYLPKAKFGYKYFFVLVQQIQQQINKFDIEPIKNKESETALKALKAMKHIFARKILTKPY